MEYSIIMPVYKRLDVINFSLNSILSQTLKPHELIIVDNNTNKKDTQSLKLILESFKENFKNKIIYIKSNKNSGAQARNLGAKVAKGELLAFLDSDVILDNNYYEILIEYFSSKKDLIAIQGIDRNLLNSKKEISILKKIVDKLIYSFEQFFETSLLFNKKFPYVSPSLAVSHPKLEDEFEVSSQWISTCAGIFKRSLFQKYQFPEQFVTYSNNEYVMFSYDLFRNSEGEMIYTSKAKYKDIQTASGRISSIELMYQIQTYDLYIFFQLFEINLKNIFIYLKSRLGHLIYYVFRLILKRNKSPQNYIHSVFSIFYPLFHLVSIIRGDLSFYENDFPSR